MDRVEEEKKSKGKRQKSKVKSSHPGLIFAFCLLPFAFCLLPFAF
jgi:hypothetical protein